MNKVLISEERLKELLARDAILSAVEQNISENLFKKYVVETNEESGDE